tara:strand:- start:550 stop:666 length:117 start_codon:yes stop_codon:yes gene_type:complete
MFLFVKVMLMLLQVIALKPFNGGWSRFDPDYKLALLPL